MVINLTSFPRFSTELFRYCGQKGLKILFFSLNFAENCVRL